MLAHAGITSIEQLRGLGALSAYIRARQAKEGVCLNLLWTLESALTGQAWREISRNHHTSLLQA